MALTYADFMKMSPEERSLLGKRVLTVRWWDAEQVRLLASQKWFAGFRRDLNESGKMSVNLGVLQFEQGGKAASIPESEIPGTVTEFFEKTKPLTLFDLEAAIGQCLSSTVFKPRLVMLEGELITQLSERRYIELMLAHVADFLGVDTVPRANTRAIEGSVLREYASKLRTLFEMTGGTDWNLRSWLAKTENLKKERFRGVELAALVIDIVGGRTGCQSVLCPLSAIPTFPNEAGFSASVLGWLEHAGGPQIFVRPVAIADTMYFENAMGR